MLCKYLPISFFSTALGWVLEEPPAAAGFFMAFFAAGRFKLPFITVFGFFFSGFFFTVLSTAFGFFFSVSFSVWSSTAFGFFFVSLSAAFGVFFVSSVFLAFSFLGALGVAAVCYQDIHFDLCNALFDTLYKWYSQLKYICRSQVHMNANSKVQR